MQKQNIEKWIDAAEDLSSQELRRAMRIVLYAVSNSTLLRSQMILKGGILLDLKYHTGRFTRDIDFSTSAPYQSFDEHGFIEELQFSIDKISNKIDPELACVIQSWEVKPKASDRNFQTLKINIGYCLRSSKTFRRLQVKQCPTVVQVDYSFNENTKITDRLTLSDNTEILVYSISDQIAEKYRALLQQIPSRRNRIRRQDAFDIYRIIENGIISSAQEKISILEAIKEKCEARLFSPNKDSILDPEIKKRSRQEYEQLADEIEIELPEFDAVFDLITDYYRSLPW